MTTCSPNEHQCVILEALEGVLADTAVLYYKTHGFHWNVVSPEFYGLHIMFEKFYNEVWESLDEIAERMRALGGNTPSSLKALLKKATLKETEEVPNAQEMIKILRDDYRMTAERLRDVASFSKAHGDGVTENMMLEKATFLEKAAWMLESSLSS